MEPARDILTHWHSSFRKYYYADGEEEKKDLMNRLTTAKSDKDIPEKYKKHPALSTYKERVEAKREKEEVEEGVRKLTK